MEYCNIREWPSSLRYLTEGIICLEIGKREKPIKNGIHILPKSFGNPLLRCYGESVIDLDFCMKNDFFPALRYITIKDSNIVSIPEGIFRLSRLKEIYIRNCKELREIQIPRLTQSIREVIILKCPSLLPKSSSRLLNQVRSLSLIIK